MKKQYEKPVLEIQEFEIENTTGNLCSGVVGLLPGVPIFEDPKVY